MIIIKFEADVTHGGRVLSLLTVRRKKKAASSVEVLGPQLSFDPGNVSHEPRTGSSVLTDNYDTHCWIPLVLNTANLLHVRMAVRHFHSASPARKALVVETSSSTTSVSSSISQI